MSSITGRSASSQGDVPFDTRVCAEIGGACQRVRAERGLTLAQVGETLLLSTRQVRALEDVDLSAFHNPRFFVAALRKYAGFAGIEATALERLLPPPRQTAVAREVPAAPEPVRAADSGGRRGLVLVVVSAAAVVLAVAVAARGGYTWWQSARPAATLPAPSATPAPVPTPASAEPAASVVAPALTSEPAVTGTPGAPGEQPAAAVAAAAPTLSPPSDIVAPFGSVFAPKGTWMFLRYIDNSVVERPLAEGERAVFDKPPVYLAVGSPDAELTLGRQRVNTAPFIVNGQLRLRASDFNALTAAVEPTPIVPSDAIR